MSDEQWCICCDQPLGDDEELVCEDCIMDDGCYFENDDLDG